LITVVNHITLDGVMQAPAAPDEDRRDGFEHGGWAAPYGDEVLGRYMGERMSKGKGGALLFGRRTYEHMASFWPTAPEDIPYTRVINSSRKYVASRTLSGELEWNNSHVLEGDAADAVATVEENLVVLGSGELAQSLLARDLIDAYVLTIHPLLLGQGRRLFPDGGSFAKLTLVECVPTTTGVLIANYERTNR
jgi:dihydrofolate reductase